MDQATELLQHIVPPDLFRGPWEEQAGGQARVAL